jgi:hypothetical protein
MGDVTNVGGNRVETPLTKSSTNRKSKREKKNKEGEEEEQREE